MFHTSLKWSHKTTASIESDKTVGFWKKWLMKHWEIKLLVFIDNILFGNQDCLWHRIIETYSNQIVYKLISLEGGCNTAKLIVCTTFKAVMLYKGVGMEQRPI